jgi:hypothetical protein
MEYKVTSLNAPNIGGFSSGNSKSPKYGVTSIYSINANANPSIVYQEAFPDARLAYYSVAENIGVSMSSTHGMQARSLAVANVPINPKDITSTLFYQNGFGILSASPSTLVMPGYWRKIGDSGATAFRYGIVGSADGGEGTYDVYGNIIDTDTPATFSVQAGDLVIATTMLAKHVVNAVAGGDIQQIFSWTRNRVISGGQNAHGMSIWISKVSTTYSISRAIDQYPGARFLVFRYDPTGVAPALPAVTPITTGGGSSYWRDVRGRPLE